MASVTSLGTAFPPFAADNQTVLAAATQWLGAGSDEFNLFERFLRSSRTLNRHFVVPPLEIINQGGAEARAGLFEKWAPQLGEKALLAALEKAQLKPSDLNGLIFTSCSCPAIPAVDTYLVDRLEMRRDIVRIPSYQFGCAGGVIGLGLAARLAPSLGNIAIVSAELCSLVFHIENSSPSNLVGAAIFGDGAAAAIVRPQDTAGFQIIDHRSFLIPESRHLMGYDIRDTGSHLRLDKELPESLVSIVPGLVDKFLSDHSLSRSDIPWWLFHPGGTKILATLQESLNLKTWQSCWAGRVLESIGNLSSATILFVLDLFMRESGAAKGDRAMIVGVGPGLTIEIILGQIN